MRSAGLLIAMCGALLASAPARAAEGCPKLASCHTIRVALDHTGLTPGTLPLAYARVPATGVATGKLVLLSGGPGEGDRVHARLQEGPE